jgi:hypothetical protein
VIEWASDDLLSYVASTSLTKSRCCPPTKLVHSLVKVKFPVVRKAGQMEDNSSWVGVAQVVTAIFSTLTALVALWVSIRSDRRSREALKVQTYLHLRSGFLDIYRELGRLDDPKADAVELRLARQAYWHHAWDEWYIANRLAPREFSELWDGFFGDAVKSGYKHPALRATFDELASNPDAGFGAYAENLIRELRRQEDEAAR